MTTTAIVGIGWTEHGDIARAILDVTGADAVVLLLVHGNELSANCRANENPRKREQLTRIVDVLLETASQIERGLHPTERKSVS
jgi:hypothetical protein